MRSMVSRTVFLFVNIVSLIVVKLRIIYLISYICSKTVTDGQFKVQLYQLYLGTYITLGINI